MPEHHDNCTRTGGHHRETTKWRCNERDRETVTVGGRESGILDTENIAPCHGGARHDNRKACASHNSLAPRTNYDTVEQPTFAHSPPYPLFIRIHSLQ